MTKKIKEEIQKLHEAGIIDEVTLQRIETYYQSEKQSGQSRQLLLFSLFGSILTGLGIVLLVAHNWDHFSRTLKTIVAFLPLLLSQGLTVYGILKKNHSEPWRESTSTLQVFALGSTLAMISQIYQIPGDTASFVLMWSLLVLPQVYLIPSTMTAILYLAGITFYGAEEGYGSSSEKGIYLYWILLLIVLPYAYRLILKEPKRNFTFLFHWMLALSPVINLGTIARTEGTWLFVAYAGLFGLYYYFGNLGEPFQQAWKWNSYRVIGSAGMVILLLILSFRGIWTKNVADNPEMTNPEFWVTILILSSLAALGIYHRRDIGQVLPMMIIPFLIFPLMVLPLHPLIPVILMNVILFVLALWIIRRALMTQQVTLLNYGLLIMTALIIARFFDTNMSFIWRGILFVLIGAGFFIANYRMAKINRS